MSKKLARICEIKHMICELQREEYALEVEIKKRKGVLRPGDAYVVTHTNEVKNEHWVYYYGASVVCLNAFSDVTTSFCSDMLDEVTKYSCFSGKVTGKKMPLVEAIKYL